MYTELTPSTTHFISQMKNNCSDTMGKRCIYIATAHIMQFALRSDLMMPMFCNK